MCTQNRKASTRDALLRRHPLISSLMWLGPLALLWGSAIVLAHQTTLWAITWTYYLFGGLCLLTYVGLWGWAVSVSRKPRPTLFNGMTFTLCVVVILLCLEALAVLKLVRWRLLFQQLTGSVQHASWAFQHDPELEFRRRPYDHWVGRPTSDIESGWTMPASQRQPLVFTYDRWGYRNAEDLDQADVVLIGDSYVEGWYVSDEHTTARRLQEQLNQSVANLGIAGYGTMQELRVLQRDAMRFHPKVVIWFFFEGNDLYDDERFENFLNAASPEPPDRTASPLGMAQAHGWRQRSFTLALWRQLRRWMHPIMPNHTPYFGRLVAPKGGERTVYFSSYAAIPWTPWVANRWETARDRLAQAVAFCRSRGIHLLIAFVPIKFRVYQPFIDLEAHSPCHTWTLWPIVERFMAFCQSAGIPCLDLTPLFQAAMRHGILPYSDVDSHWSPEGHQLVADHLAVELRKRGWLTAADPSR